MNILVSYDILYDQCSFFDDPQEPLNSYWSIDTRAPSLGLHEANLGLQSITLSMDEKSTWQVWIMLVGIVGGCRGFFRNGSSSQIGRNAWQSSWDNP